ncbi:putative methyl-accepting chemotaxis transducer protein [Ralstonia solanacearum IPO1609]|uniref:Methyl-accepting chemotaxis transducer protein n=1 Tax=Ralstonia solanacearum IPO1609 TaxID=564066 RepID=A0A7U7JEP0_RALSL|nr:putative methyl-accepting chemotaxis transducer protein [Ralstonia solanacearum IPO1609]
MLMWKWMDSSLRTRLTVLVAAFAAMIAVVGGTGIATGRATNADLRAVYLEDAKGVDLLARDTVNLLWARIHLTNFDSVSSPEELTKLLKDAHAMVNVANEAWAAFAKLPVAEADRAQLQAADAARARFVKGALEPAITALERSDLTTYRDLNTTQVPQLFAVYDAALQPLVKARFAYGQARFDRSQSRYATSVWLSGGLLLAALVLSVVARGVLGRTLVRPLERAYPRVRAHGRGRSRHPHGRAHPRRPPRRDRAPDACRGVDAVGPAEDGRAGPHRLRRDCRRHPADRRRQCRSVAAHGRTGQFAGGNRLQHGRADLDREAERG